VRKEFVEERIWIRWTYAVVDFGDSVKGQAGITGLALGWLG
jgi:hypothetical protein